jgi:hypothetical protein
MPQHQKALILNDLEAMMNVALGAKEWIADPPEAS